MTLALLCESFGDGKRGNKTSAGPPKDSQNNLLREEFRKSEANQKV